MHERTPNIHAAPDSRALTNVLGCYHKPNCARGVLELVITGGAARPHLDANVGGSRHRLLDLSAARRPCSGLSRAPLHDST